MTSEPTVTAPVTPRVPPIVALPTTERSDPAAIVVVDAMDPGATKVEGTEMAIWLPEPVVVISLAVPTI